MGGTGPGTLSFGTMALGAIVHRVAPVVHQHGGDGGSLTHAKACSNREIVHVCQRQRGPGQETKVGR